MTRVILRGIVRRATVLALLLLALASPAARANGDPASDVLLSQDSFLPYAPPTQPALKSALERVLASARTAGYGMKVALIASPSDLGAYSQLFNQPQAYADLLNRELSALNPHGDPLDAPHLLVVMPGGFGGTNLGDGVDAALRPITIQGDAQSDGLARAAIEAVARIATEDGHPVAVPPEARTKLTASDRSTSRGGTSPLVFLAPALLLFGGLLAAGQISKRRRTDRSDLTDT